MSALIPSKVITHLPDLAEEIRALGLSMGFQAVRFTTPNTEAWRESYEAWLAQSFHGDMDWMTRNMDKRFNGANLHDGAQSAIVVRMDYRPENEDGLARLNEPNKAYIAHYALGRDYHKVIRKRLTQFGKAIETLAGAHGYRGFVDSAPVLERQLANQAGMGWLGKNSLLLAPGAGSWFFLGELFTDLPLPIDPPFESEHCGSCNQCIIDCPTDAFVAPGVLDANKCISYLTIEYDGVIPEALRPKMGNRIYGCDDCQLVCPHNQKAPTTQEPDFSARSVLNNLNLLEAFCWSEADFSKHTEGTAIRRIGYERWQRNVAIALGNGPSDQAVINTLNQHLTNASDMVKPHIEWALTQLVN